MSTAAVFINNKKVFDTTWRIDLLYTLLELKILISLIKLISCFLSKKIQCLHRRWNIIVKRYAGRGTTRFRPVPALYSIYTNDTSQTPDAYLGLFANDFSIYATDCKECYALRKLQRGLNAIETWYERWNIKINEDKT
jgi:hypothetical protein